MPIINISTSSGTVEIKEEVESEYGESVTSTTIGNVSFISEDITKQINGLNTNFITSYSFIKGSLDVYINGLKMSSGFDFMENNDLSSFYLISLNNDIVKVLNVNSCITIKYAKVG